MLLKCSRGHTTDNSQPEHAHLSEGEHCPHQMPKDEVARGVCRRKLFAAGAMPAKVPRGRQGGVAPIYDEAMGKIEIMIPAELHAQIKVQAEADGVSMSKWMRTLAEEKIFQDS